MFDVELHPVLFTIFLKKLGPSYVIPRTKRLPRPENTGEVLDACVEDAFNEDPEEPHNKRGGDNEKGWVVDGEIWTDGGTCPWTSRHLTSTTVG